MPFKERCMIYDTVPFTLIVERVIGDGHYAANTFSFVRYTKHQTDKHNKKSRHTVWCGCYFFIKNTVIHTDMVISNNTYQFCKRLSTHIY
jgi:hypothetical protein